MPVKSWRLNNMKKNEHLIFYLLNKKLFLEFHDYTERDLKPELMECLNSRETITLNYLMRYFDHSIPLDRNETIEVLTNLIETLKGGD